MPVEESRFVQVGSGELWFDQRGDGLPVLYLHGFALDRRMWDDQFAASSAGYRQIRLDLRGFGQSSVPREGERYSHLEDVIALLDELDIEKAVLVGLSLGANVALHACLARPERVAAAILASSSLPGLPWRGKDERPREAAGAIAAAEGVEAARAYWARHPLFASARENPALLRRLMEMVQDYSGWHWAHQDPQAPMPSMPDRLGEIGVPMLVLSGGRDLEAYQDIAERIVAGVPRSQLHKLPLAGHLLTMEAPEAFEAATKAFLASLGPFPAR